MDIRSFFAGLFALVALVGAIVLYAMDKEVGAVAACGLATSGLTFMFGLHSEPWSGDGQPDA